MFAGALSALAGGYWDDAWPTERGRDDFLIAPHIGHLRWHRQRGCGADAVGLMSARAQGIVALWRHKPLALAPLSAMTILASAPIDNAWHIASGATR